MTDWQVGDLAVCVSNEPCDCCGMHLPAPEIGQVLTVAGVKACEGSLFLLLPDGPTTRDGIHTNDPWFAASEYRKVVKDAHEACEEEFITLLRKSRVRA